MKVETILAVTRALHDANVRFLVCGGQAVVAHGYVRFTADLDIAVQLEPDHIRRAVAALEGAGYRPALPVSGSEFADAETRRRWAEEKNMTVLSFISNADPLGTIDVFILDQFDFEAEYASATILKLAPGLYWPVLRLETLISLKKAVGRPIDLDDVDHLTALKAMQSTPGAT